MSFPSRRFVLSFNGCAQPNLVLVDEAVTVGAGGDGSAPVFFSANAGQRIHIDLTGSANTAPYGHLEFPNGESIYTPELSVTDNQTNSDGAVLPQTGQYTYVVFDSTNHGGTVNVRIELIQ